MNIAYILLGTNIGDKGTNLSIATTTMSAEVGRIRIRSSIYETAPWGITTQPSFLNQVIAVETLLTAEKLLEILLSIETKMGRVRALKWGERLIDLDILYFNNDIVVKENLKIPHPELHNRKFTLIPLVEIAPYFKHPIFNVSNQLLLNRCLDTGIVTKKG